MAYQPAPRNYDGVQWGALRERVERVYCEAHDTLAAAYYDHWRHGESCPVTVGGRDLDRLSKEDFDLLHAALDAMRTLALDRANELAVQRNAGFAAAMDEVQRDGLTVRERCGAKVAEAAAKGFQLRLGGK